MASVKICDSCGERLDEAQVDLDFEIVNNDGTLQIELNNDRDWCAKCARRAMNRLALLTNEKLRVSRKGEK